MAHEPQYLKESELPPGLRGDYDLAGQEDEVEIVPLPIYQRIYNFFADHLKKEKVNYFQHLFQAGKLFYFTQITAFIFLLHGFLPGLFEYTGSDRILNLANILERKRKELHDREVKKLERESDKKWPKKWQ